jgi:hypothetical protein
MSVLTHALIVADFGHAVFAVVSGGKRPLRKGWQAEATTDPARIRQLLSDRTLNYGIRTELVAVLDFDRRRLAEEFYQKYRSSVTTIVATPRGGIHFWFANDGIRNSQNDGWDVRGKGGFVVGIGSAVGGVEYRLVTPVVAIVELKPFPDEFRPNRKTQSMSRINEDDVFRRIASARAWLAAVPPAVSGQRGHDRMFYACCAMFGKFGLSMDQAIPLVLEFNEGCQPPFRHRDIQHKLQDAWTTTCAAQV